MSDFSGPCGTCVEGRHEQCRSALCGCIADHPDDDDIMRGFKRLKRQLHPEREGWTAGGWNEAPIRVEAETGTPTRKDAS